MDSWVTVGQTSGLMVYRQTTPSTVTLNKASDGLTGYRTIALNRQSG